MVSNLTPYLTSITCYYPITINQIKPLVDSFQSISHFYIYYSNFDNNDSFKYMGKHWKLIKVLYLGNCKDLSKNVVKTCIKDWKELERIDVIWNKKNKEAIHWTSDEKKTTEDYTLWCGKIYNFFRQTRNCISSGNYRISMLFQRFGFYWYESNRKVYVKNKQTRIDDKAWCCIVLSISMLDLSDNLTFLSNEILVIDYLYLWFHTGWVTLNYGAIVGIIESTKRSWTKSKKRKYSAKNKKDIFLSF